LVHFAIDKRDTPGIRPCVSTPITAVRVEDWVLNSANHYHETASHLLHFPGFPLGSRREATQLYLEK
jgi:hypothetical protein